MSGIVRLKFLGSGGYYVTDTTPFRGMDFETKQFVIAEDNDVVLVSETYAQMLLDLPVRVPAAWIAEGGPLSCWSNQVISEGTGK